MDMNSHSLAQEIGTLFLAKKLMLTTAESCTGGQVAEVITIIPGSSQWFERGFVTYSNAAKREMLGVKEATLAQFGAVSGETAKQMAEGALKHSHANISLAVTGIAGPDGGSAEKPVGTVWFAWANHKNVVHIQHKLFIGDRISIRDQATFYVLDELVKRLKDFL